jgi:hypothetical protein
MEEKSRARWYECQFSVSSILIYTAFVAVLAWLWYPIYIAAYLLWWFLFDGSWKD